MYVVDVVRFSICESYNLSRSSYYVVFIVFFFQAEDGIRDLVRSRGLGDVYKRQPKNAVKFNSDEIMRLRKVPMTPGTSLKQERARIVGDLIIHCLSLIHI